MKVDLLVFNAAPYAFNKDVVTPTAFAVHADANVFTLQNGCKRFAGELATLISVKDIWLAVNG